MQHLRGTASRTGWRQPKSAKARMFSKATGTFKSPKRKCRDASEHIGRPPSWQALLLDPKGP